jgi:hypothetical protein
MVTCREQSGDETKFWRTDHNSGNLVFGNPILGDGL